LGNPNELPRWRRASDWISDGGTFPFIRLKMNASRTDGWPKNNMFRNLRFRTAPAGIRSYFARIFRERPGVLVVTPNDRAITDLRLCGIQEGWHTSFARSLDAALPARCKDRTQVILCDEDTLGVSWRRAIELVLNSGGPALFILMSWRADCRLRSAVIDSGGYDILAKTAKREAIVSLVNSAVALVETIDGCAPVYSGAFRKTGPGSTRCTQSTAEADAARRDAD
jgi:hypothetical protein